MFMITKGSVITCTYSRNREDGKFALVEGPFSMKRHSKFSQGCHTTITIEQNIYKLYGEAGFAITNLNSVDQVISVWEDFEVFLAPGSCFAETPDPARIASIVDIHDLLDIFAKTIPELKQISPVSLESTSSPESMISSASAMTKSSNK